MNFRKAVTFIGRIVSNGSPPRAYTDRVPYRKSQPQLAAQRLNLMIPQVAAVVHLVGIRAERDLVEEITEGRTLVHAAEFVDGIDKFVDIRFFVDALVRVVGVHAQYAAVVDDVAHDLVARHSSANQSANPFLVPI